MMLETCTTTLMMLFSKITLVLCQYQYIFDNYTSNVRPVFSVAQVSLENYVLRRDQGLGGVRFSASHVYSIPIDIHKQKKRPDDERNRLNPYDSMCQDMNNEFLRDLTSPKSRF